MSYFEMSAPYWSTIVKDLVTVAGVIIGGTWAAWKWGYGETLRKRREMPSPDGALSATAVQLGNGTTAVTLHALWRNRGSLSIELCSKHSVVEAFKLNEASPTGPLELKEGPNVTSVATTKPSWAEYIMEPNTDSVMQEHFVLNNNFVYAFRWNICLGSSLPNYEKSHPVCTRELLWRASGDSTAPPIASIQGHPQS
jgi:hypothetical protein